MAFNWGNSFRGGAQGAAVGGQIGGPWGAAAGGTIGALGGGFFGGDEEDETDKLLNGIPDELKQYLMPYINQGQGALGRAGKEYEGLLNNPNDIISRIGSGYKQSPGYQWKLDQGLQGVGNAQAAGGMAGTGQHQQLAGQLAEHLADQDYNDYMTNALGLYGKGLEGEQNLANMGQTSSQDLATSLANLKYSKAGLNYKRGANKNQMNSDMFSSILAQLSKKGT